MPQNCTSNQQIQTYYCSLIDSSRASLTACTVAVMSVKRKV